MSNDRPFFINSDYTSKDRFDIAKLLEYTDNYDPLTSTFLHEMKKLPEYGKWVVQVEEARSDILAYKIFGDPQFWWIILFYNDLTENDDLATGMVVKFPGLPALEDLYFSMKARESAA